MTQQWCCPELRDAVDEYRIAGVDLFAYLKQDPRVGLVAGRW